jgi:hypothetical protein
MDSLEYLLQHISEGENHLQDTVVVGRKTLEWLGLLWLSSQRWWVLMNMAKSLQFP